MTKYHYTYRITNIVEQKHYYGARSSSIHPTQDLGIKYFSSSTDKEFMSVQKLNPENFKYKVIKIFETREEANLLESKLHKKFEVHKNKNFYNRCIANDKFSYYGCENRVYKKGSITVFSLIEQRFIVIDRKVYDTSIHITNNRKKSNLPDEYIMKLDFFEFNRKYKTDLQIDCFNIKSYKKFLNSLCHSLMMSGDKNPSKNEVARRKQSERAKNRPGNNTGKIASLETKQKQSESAKNRKKKCRVKTFLFISPNNNQHMVVGERNIFIEKHNLSLNVLIKYKNSVVPSENRKGFMTERRTNTTGWLMKEL